MEKSSWKRACGQPRFYLMLILAALAAVISLRHVAIGRAAEMPGEAGLNPDGAPFEINRDAQGHLWISDVGAGEIWRVDPVTTNYTVFEGLQAPSDARRDGQGRVWWGDGQEGRFGRLNLTTLQATFWAAPGAAGLIGTELDGSGNFWATADEDALLFRFQPDASRLCTYAIPDGGAADYLTIAGGRIWLGDWQNSRLLRLDAGARTFDVWDLPDDAAPQDLLVDSSDVLWYTDTNNGLLGRFEGDNETLVTFLPPAGGAPQMLASSGNSFWFSTHRNSAFGRLVPAWDTSVALTRGSVDAEVTCAEVEPQETLKISSRNGQLAWKDVEYPLLVDEAGWRIFDLPDGAFPWGVIADGEQVWFVDTGRQVLGRISVEAGAAVTACKVADADGKLATNDDRTPLSGWRIYLLVEGRRQGDGRLTGPNGCVNWTGLEPGLRYGVEEEQVGGWTPLNAVIHDFGIVEPGARLRRTFINSESPDYSPFVYLPVIGAP